TFTYEINADTWRLDSVVKPEVRDPNSPDAAPVMISPRIDFEYTATDWTPRLIQKSNGDTPWDSHSLIRWILPSKIQDARRTATENDSEPQGNETVFTYQPYTRLVPTGIQKIDNAPVA